MYSDSDSDPNFLLVGQKCTIAPYREDLIDALALQANNRKIWRNLRNAFPHPYTRDHAELWISLASQEPSPSTNLAIFVQNQFAGGIGLQLPNPDDVECRNAELGYWLGEEFWGQGIATDAVGVFVDYAWKVLPQLHRLQAYVTGWNEASKRVLLKNGFIQEVVLKDYYFKDGEFVDAVLFYKLRPADL
eukprot:TRINITY_DN14329_c0_g1_i1.p1 TRINITY_DN14329_c0_g1~~TRINITY_DN14329_c0_g1_i1.p1  ORF type:complete len:189 (+),score=20.20 TRINITY_DN14329_c0_g1_i1:51-617(+)